MRNVIHYNEVNEVAHCSKSEKENIVSGMGATMYVGSDRYAMVVVEVLSPKKIKVTYADEYLKDFVTDENGIDRMPESIMKELRKYSDYNSYSGHSHGLLHTYTLRKNGRWLPVGAGLWETCAIHVGKASEYFDPSF